MTRRAARGGRAWAKDEGIGVWSVEVRIPMDKTSPVTRLVEITYHRGENGEWTHVTQDLRVVGFHVEPRQVREVKPARRGRGGRR